MLFKHPLEEQIRNLDTELNICRIALKQARADRDALLTQLREMQKAAEKVEHAMPTNRERGRKHVA
jgi:chromosome segregation ATPase